MDTDTKSNCLNIYDGMKLADLKSAVDQMFRIEPGAMLGEPEVMVGLGYRIRQIKPLDS